MIQKKFIAMAVVLLGFLALGARAADAPAKPNILFIFCDDHAVQAVSAYGHNLNKTPNIDKLGAEGMRFDRCMVNNSLCGPCRASVITGKYSHMNGFYNNTNSKFDGSQVTFPKLMQKAGYQTCIIGKWHLVSDPTGFDFWEILPGQGQYYNPPMTRNGEKVKHTGYTTDIITDETLDWLKNKRDKSKPFVMMCQHKAPHREWEPSLKHLHDYDGVKWPEPATLFDDYSGRGKAEHSQEMQISKAMNAKDLKLDAPKDLNPEQRKEWDAYYDQRIAEFKKLNLSGQDLVRWKYQAYLHDYFATIASVDDSVGKLTDYLKESGLEKNTLVIYTSDQGFYLGEHGWFDKRWIFEESLHTPLMVRWPGIVKPGSVNKDMVSNVDFAETFLEAAGVPVPAEMQGHSLMPLLKGQTPGDWPKSFYYHYYEHFETGNPGPHNVARHDGIVTDRYKLVHFYEPSMNYWELFDLQKDPKEMTSVYDTTEYKDIQADLQKQLDKARHDLKVPDKDAPDTYVKAPAGGKKGAGAKKGAAEGKGEPAE